MKRFSLFLSVAALVLDPVFFAYASFDTNLRLGDQNQSVLELQKFLNTDQDTRVALSGVGSPGFETDYFGSLTLSAVNRFQNKYKYDVLVPVGLYSATGFVGPSTRAKLNALAVAKSQTSSVSAPQSAAPTSVPAYQAPISNTVAQKKPVVSAVYPDYVKKGDIVTVVGENFTPTGNIVELGDGPVDSQFLNLPSTDGKTIKFVYVPPDVQTMTESQILSLPYDTLQKIEKPIVSAGGTLDDVVHPYKNITNDDELKAALEKNGHSWTEMYHYFHIIVKNSNGATISGTALLHGLRKFPFDTLADNSLQSIVADFGGKIKKWVDGFVPTASAQLYGGGFTTGIIMVCTCSAALLTFQLDLAGGGSNLYVYYAGYIPTAGSCLVPGSWLGSYIQSAGVCAIYVGLACIEISGNMPGFPIGCSL